MARPERPVDPEAGPVARFAVDLRELRRQAGSPGYRVLARRAHYSPTTLAQAARGESFPSLPVTLAYVRACGGDAAEWERRWRTTAVELGPRRPGDANAVVEGDGEVDGCAPYMGLAAYGPDDAAWFCGRDRVIAALTERLMRQRFVAVVGASGSGKSSVLRAGLLPALSAESGRWVRMVMTPGARPLEECTVRLAAELGLPASQLVTGPAEHSRGFSLAFRQLLVGEPESTEIVLVVDQFEEVFTLCHDERERDQFIAMLLNAADGPESRTRVVIGLRADFYAHCARHARLADALQDAQMLVGPMNTDELTQAITQPAVRAGLMVEKTLVTTVVHDAVERPGSLPFVSHALWETWRRRHGSGLFLADYQSAGGLNGAIAQTADHLYNTLGERERRIVRGILLRLTALGEGTEDTRRRVRHKELLNSPDRDAVASVLSRLAAARLVTLGTDTVEVAHEALIHSWPKLQAWLAEDRETVLAHQRLIEAAAEWERHGRDEGLLYRGARLAGWQDRPLDRLNDTERDFLTASRRSVAEEHRLRRRRTWMAVAGLSSGVAVVTVLAMIALLMAVRANDERALAAGRQLVADARAQLPFDPELGLLLAREAHAVAPNDDSEAVLRQAAADSHIRATLPSPPDGHGRPIVVTGAAFSPDGKHVATTHQDGSLRVRDLDPEHITHGKPRVLKGHPNVVMRTPAFSPDSDRIAAGDDSGTVWIWDTAGRYDPVKLRGNKPVGRLTFSPDGKQLAVDQSYQIHIWDTAGNTQPEILQRDLNAPVEMAFSSDGKQLVTSLGGPNIRVWDLNAGTSVFQIGAGDPSEVTTFSPDSRHVATAEVDGTVRIWDRAGNKSTKVIGNHGGTVYDLAYSPDGHWIASTGHHGIVKIWNAEHSASPTVLRGHRGIVLTAAFSPDGRFVITAGMDGTAKIWDVDEVQDLSVLRGHSGPVVGAEPSPDRRRVASGGQDGIVRIWDIDADNAPIELSRHNRPVTQVRFSPDGHHLATVDESGVVLVWNTNDFTDPVQLRLPSPGQVQVDFSPDGKRLATTGSPGSVHVWSITRSGEVEKLPRLPDTPFEPIKVAWSQDGRHIASAGKDTVAIWDLHRRTVRTLPVPQGRIATLTFAPDGTYLAGGSDDGTTYLWSRGGTSNPIALRGHQGTVWSATFSPDSRNLVTVGADATIRIWKTSRTSEPLIIDGFRASIQTVAPLGKDQFLTAHDDGTIRIWRCRACSPVAEVLAYASQHVTRHLTVEERRTYLPDSP